MNEYAVHVEGISKLYRIGARRDSRSFRETLTDLLTLRGRQQDEESRDLWALRDVSFEVRRGQAIGIIGQNGAGKSTLLKILSRITAPTSGRIEVRGRVSSLLEVGTGFHAELTGRENIALNGAILGMTRAEIRQRFDEIVAFAEVERFIDTPVKYYSSGMYMRLAFAVAAHLEPEILVVDEVLAVGDAAFQSKCLRKMNDVASHGRTVLFVSHNMPAVKSLCQTAVWLKNGELVDQGLSGLIVDRYLQHAMSRSAVEELSHVIIRLPADPLFTLYGIRLLQHGQETVQVVNGEPLYVEIEFNLSAATRGFTIGLSLYDLDETLLVESFSGGDAPELPIVSAGRHCFRCVIPANLLSPRPYQLRVDPGISDVRHCLPEPVRINFDVQQTGIVNRAFPGFSTSARLSPHMEWIDLIDRHAE